MTRRSLSVLATLLLIQALLCWRPDALRAADVTIDTSVSGPVSGAGGTFTVTSSGVISGAGNGIEAGTGGTAITTLDVQGSGSVTVLGIALNVANGATLPTITNAGTMSGDRVIQTNGGTTLGTITNSGTMSGTGYGMVLGGTSGTISNLAGGRIAGTADDGIQASGSVTSLSNAGTIAGGTGTNDSGVELVSSGTIGTLTNSGIIGTTDGYYGIFTRDSSGIGSIVNSGTIQSYYYAINHEGNTITSLVNQAGGLIKSYNSNAVGGGGIGSIDNYGTIEGDSGIRNNRSPVIGTITNRSGGVIRGTYDAAIYTERGMTSITNEAGGLIESTAWHGILLQNEVPTITNDGTIRTTYSSADGIRNNRAMENLTNSGTIQGGASGRGLYLDEVTGTVTNTATGLIEGGRNGYYVGDDTNEIVNAGQFRGGETGIYAGYAITSLVNQAGGVISGTTRAGLKLEESNGTITNQAGGRIESASGDGINVGGYGTSYVTGTIANAGLIEGGTSGVQVTNGRLHKLTNSGTIAYTGAAPGPTAFVDSGTGPAVFVGSGGVLGDATGDGGAAIVSTGGVALLDGTIVNQGTIHHGFTIENQHVTVSAGGGVGTFTNGTLELPDGDLTFVDGRTNLAADIDVAGGVGTVFNEAVLGFSGERTFNGNFSQTSSATLSSLISGESTYGSIVIDGAAAFGGTLDLDLDVGFDFAEGQTYDLFTFASRTGGFTGLSVDGTALTSAGTGQWTYGSLILEEQWTGTSMSITAVPEPSTLVLGAAGIACAVWMRHRRRASRKA